MLHRNKTFYWLLNLLVWSRNSLKRKKLQNSLKRVEKWAFQKLHYTAEFKLTSDTNHWLTASSGKFLKIHALGTWHLSLSSSDSPLSRSIFSAHWLTRQWPSLWFVITYWEKSKSRREISFSLLCQGSETPVSSTILQNQQITHYDARSRCPGVDWTRLINDWCQTLTWTPLYCFLQIFEIFWLFPYFIGNSEADFLK